MINALGKIAAIVSAATLFSCNIDETPAVRNYPAKIYPDRITQSITEDPSTQISLSWRVSNSVDEGFAEYLPFSVYSGFSDKIKLQEAECVPVEFEGVTDNYFHAKLKNLQPGTKYQVRVGYEGNMSEWFSVATAHKEFKPFYFLHFAGVQHDIREFAPRIYRTGYRNFPDARFILHSGDLVQARGGDNDWGELAYSGSWIFSTIPQVPSAGNSDHWETRTESDFKRVLYPQWHGVFNLPETGPDIFRNLVYYFDYPGVRVITLYSGLEAAKDDRPTYVDEEVRMTEELFFEQIDWLEEVLAVNEQPWVVVHIHHPVVCAREGREYEMHDEYLKPLLEKYEVDLVLHGHEHLYARGRSADNLKPLYVTSIAGPRTKEVDHSRSWIEKSAENMQLYQVIHITPESLKMQAFNLVNEIVDEVVIRK